MLLHNNCLFSSELKNSLRNICNLSWFKFLKLHLFIVGVQMTTLRSPFFPPIMWDLGTKLRLFSFYWLSHLLGPCLDFYEKKIYAWWINHLSFLITAGPHGWSYVYFVSKGHVLPYFPSCLLIPFIQIHVWANLPSPILSFLLLRAVVIGIHQMWFLLSLSNSTWMLPVFSSNKKSRKQTFFFVLIVMWSVNSAQNTGSLKWTPDLQMTTALLVVEWQLQGWGQG